MSDTAVEFTVPDNDPATGAGWTGLPRAFPLVVSVMGQQSNPVNFTVTASAGAPAAGAPAAGA